MGLGGWTQANRVAGPLAALRRDPALESCADHVEVLYQPPDQFVLHAMQSDKAAKRECLLLEEFIQQILGFGFGDHLALPRWPRFNPSRDTKGGEAGFAGTR